jgi:hypothetical protein
VSTVPGADDGIAECAFCVGAGDECFSDDTKLGGVVTVLTRSLSTCLV